MKDCSVSHYATIVETRKDVEIYQLEDEADCTTCLHRMIEKHQAIIDVFRARLVLLAAPDDALGPPATPQALCHECTEVVDVVAGRLAAHHGMTGDGCPQNEAVAQIYLHPAVAGRIAELETALVVRGMSRHS